MGLGAGILPVSSPYPLQRGTNTLINSKCIGFIFPAINFVPLIKRAGG